MHKPTPHRGSSPFTFILKSLWICRTGGWGLLCTIILPVLIVIAVTGTICYIHKDCSYFNTYEERMDRLVTAHFNVMAFLLTFSAGVVFVFKDKQWTEVKRGNLSNHIKAFKASEHLRKPTEDEENLFTTFVDTLQEQLRELDLKLRRLYTLFICCILLIASCCLLSVIFAYQARLLQSTWCYRMAYVLAVGAIGLACLHMVIVILPISITKLIRKGLTKDSIVNYFRGFMDERNKLTEKGDRPDDELRFLD